MAACRRLKLDVELPFISCVRTLVVASAWTILASACSLFHVKSDSDADAGDASTRAVTCASNGRVCFLAPQVISTSWGLTSVSIKDSLANASKPSIVVAAHGASEFVELSTASDGLQVTSNSKTNIAPWQVVTGDFDLDGKVDVIVASPGTSSQTGGVSFWRTSSPSSWTETASQKIGLGTYAVAARSGVGNGEINAAGASYATQALVPFIGHTGAVPTAGTSLTLDIKPTALLFGSNSQLYVVGNGAAQGRLVVFDAKGGTLSKKSTSASFGKSLNDLKLGDINGDGITDVVAVDDSDASSLFSLEADAKLNWTTISQVPLPANSHAVALDDFDRDGKLDCATISGSTTTVHLCFGNGKGSFGDCIDVSHGVEQPTDIVTRDLDADRWVDVVVVGYTGRISVLHGAPSED